MESRQIIDRLLTSEEPAIRWKTRVRVLGENPKSSAIRSLQREIKRSPRVQELLSGRDADGRLTLHSEQAYAKWYGAHWVMAALADTGYPRGDRVLLPVRDQLMERWLAEHFYCEFEAETRSRAYARRGVPVMQGRHRRCASQQSSALYSVLALGLADKRAQDLVERLLHWQWPDGGWNCDKNPAAANSSFMESILPLRALSLFARETGDKTAEAAAKRAAQIFLHRRLFQRRLDGSVMKKTFVELHYPLYWHYDILAGLKVMAEVGFIDDSRCSDALDLLEDKRLPDGGWAAEKRFFTIPRERGAGKRPPAGSDLHDWGRASTRILNEWVTADALTVLQAAGRLDD
jgi:hypothetical protein